MIIFNEICKLFSASEGGWAKAHGSICDGPHHEFFVCPSEGFLRKIIYTMSNDNKFIQSMTFECSTILGKYTFGPFGEVGIDERTMECEDDQYISFFRGIAGNHINSLEVGCDLRSLYNISNNTAQNDLEQATHAIESSCESEKLPEHFDDSSYANEKRPVEFIVFYNQSIAALRVKYKNTPINEIALNRKAAQLSHVLYPTRYEVLGYTSGSTCSTLIQKIHLELYTSKSVQKSNGRGNGRDIMDSKIYTNDIETGWKFIVSFKDYSTVEKVDGRGSHYEDMNSITNETTSTVGVGTSISYQGPGAAVVIGLRVLYDIFNEGVSNTQFLGEVVFFDFSFTFNNTDACSFSGFRDCVSKIKFTNPENIEKQFYKCFN